MPTFLYERAKTLAAISYVTTTWKTQKDRSMKLLSRYAAAQILGITSEMLRDWIDKEPEIEMLLRGNTGFRFSPRWFQVPEDVLG